jgi:hypothetical protein
MDDGLWQHRTYCYTSAVQLKGVIRNPKKGRSMKNAPAFFLLEILDAVGKAIAVKKYLVHVHHSRLRGNPVCAVIMEKYFPALRFLDSRLRGNDG